MPTKIHEIPGKLVVQFEPSVKAVIDTWTNYQVSLKDFSDAILNKGLVYGKPRGVAAWIVDSSGARGAFSPECQAFIGSDIFPAFAHAGIKHFITITSESALTKMTVKEYQAKLGPNGLHLVEAKSTAEALAWLKAEQAMKRVG